ncbi:hypothetical protein [Sanyastnella coralliicola]|uniref:hypothetical protein n=1 Tax=Sanyastnella coralliicola TaxID=3069118 RepID=UPI0027B9B6A0|nr:hypothetical protein [Longitalea sp. SCSIO 12813]
MRYWNLTYNDPDRWDEVYAITGRPVPFFKGIAQGGTGSPRGVLIDVPGEASEMLGETSNVKYCNLQRTQQGAILYFKIRLEVYGIPLGDHEVLSMRRELQNRTSHPCVFTLNLASGKQIQIACDEAKAGAWELFFKKCFVRI